MCHHVLLASLGLVAVVAACGGTPTGPSSSGQPTTYLSMTSIPGQVPGNAFIQRAGLSDASFRVSRAQFSNGLERVTIVVESLRSQTIVPAPDTTWGRMFEFTMPPGVSLGLGTFEAVLPEFGIAPDAPRFMLIMYPSLSSGSCGTATTRWNISEFSASRPDAIDRLLMNFEIRCARGGAELLGEVSLAGGTTPF